MQWKLKHGKFRPRLLELVQGNSDDLVRSKSTEAFIDVSMCNRHSREQGDTELSSDYHFYGQKGPRRDPSLASAIRTLTGLAGVGFATASLILSVYDPRALPFFSDELAQYCFITRSTWGDSLERDIRPHPCWKMPLKYKLEEYLTMHDFIVRSQCRRCTRKEPLRSHRLMLSCLDLEKAAWVLRHQDNVPQDDHHSSASDESKETEKRKRVEDTIAEEAEASVSGPRRSKRSKK
ncbi:MAG: hypothetical protein Q9159_002260 [Coniocarpon cinnabarinum]